jgi:DNA repair exonuclease SbcCD ATPase subunit
MKILEMVAENYKRLRVVEIKPDGPVVQITGRNGQGKSSVLDAIWAALAGKRGFAERPVRRGTDKARLQLKLGTDKGDLLVTRVIGANGTSSLTVEDRTGKLGEPQKVLDALLGELTFDPMAFMAMTPKEQVEVLRRVVKMDVDIDELNALNAADYAARTEINRDVKRLEMEVAAIAVVQDLPNERIDEEAIMQRLNSASAINQKAAEVDRARQRLEGQVAEAVAHVATAQRAIEDRFAEVLRLKAQLQVAEEAVEQAKKNAIRCDELSVQVKERYAAAPVGEYVDVSQLTQELQQAQITNREIDKAKRRADVERQLEAEKRKALELTRAMEGREERKRKALTTAKMPIDGIVFDDREVLYKGLPLKQEGEAKQMEISTAIGMALNPKLRILRIPHGEALDPEGIEVLTRIATENDFQIWMARVDVSGAVGIVMEDGAVVARGCETIYLTKERVEVFNDA